MESDHIRALEHETVELLDLFIAPLPYPYAGGQRLTGVDLSRPRKHFTEQRETEVGLVLRLMCTIRREVAIAGFVKKIPDMHARIVRKMSNNTFHVSFQALVPLQILEDLQAWT